MIGSASTAHTFMQLGLIDEYLINVNPVVLGGGMPLFPALENPIQLELISAKTFDSGSLGFTTRRHDDRSRPASLLFGYLRTTRGRQTRAGGESSGAATRALSSN